MINELIDDFLDLLTLANSLGDKTWAEEIKKELQEILSWDEEVEDIDWSFLIGQFTGEDLEPDEEMEAMLGYPCEVFEAKDREGNKVLFVYVYVEEDEDYEEEED